MTTRSAWTRATTVTKVLSDQTALDKWKRRMVLTGVARRPELLGMVAASVGDKWALDQVAEDAMTAAGAGDRATLGTDLHAITEKLDAGETVDVPEEHLGDVASYLATLDTFGIERPPHLIERIVVNPAVEVAGTFDRVVVLTKPLTASFPDRDPVTFAPGTRMVGDLKTGANLSYGWGEIAQQLAIYAWAPVMAKTRVAERDRWGRYILPDLDAHPEEFEEMPDDIDLAYALVIHLPVGERRCALYFIDITAGWEAARMAHQVRTWRGRKNLAAPIQLITPN